MDSLTDDISKFMSGQKRSFLFISFNCCIQNKTLDRIRHMIIISYFIHPLALKYVSKANVI